MKPALLAAFIFLTGILTAMAAPGANWETVDPAAAGWALPKLEEARAMALANGATAFMVVQDGKVVAGWGNVAAKVNVASVRKSLLSALYGLAVAEGRINLDSTLASLDIDDKPPALTEAEKQATVRDLLMARSGIYHKAAYETADIRRNRPARGKHPPGTFWFYNNWDFNALGTIYRHQTGADIFQSFADRIAGPIGMEDFTASDGRYAFHEASDHPAYPFKMSARDLARFGQLYLDGGVWNGVQVLPADWVAESTNALSQPPDHNSGYGYMWWTLRTDMWGAGGAFNAGHGGQVVAYVPAKRLVVVQTVDPGSNPDGIAMRDFFAAMRLVAAAAP